MDWEGKKNGLKIKGNFCVGHFWRKIEENSREIKEVNLIKLELPFKTIVNLNQNMSFLSTKTKMFVIKIWSSRNSWKTEFYLQIFYPQENPLNFPQLPRPATAPLKNANIMSNYFPSFYVVWLLPKCLEKNRSNLWKCQKQERENSIPSFFPRWFSFGCNNISASDKKYI